MLYPQNGSHIVVIDSMTSFTLCILCSVSLLFLHNVTVMNIYSSVDAAVILYMTAARAWNALPSSLRSVLSLLQFLCDVFQLSYSSLGSRVVSMLDTDTEGPGFKSLPRRCRVTVLGKLFTPVVPLFTKQRNW